MNYAIHRCSVRLSLLTFFLTLLLATAPAGAVTEIPGFGPGGLVVASHPDGGWLLVSSDRETGMSLRATRVLPDGSVGGSADTQLVNEIEAIVRAAAVAPSGRWVGVWTGEDRDFEGSSFRAATFEADGELVRELDLTVPGEMLPATDQRSVVATTAPNGDFLVAWAARTDQTEPTTGTLYLADLFLGRFSDDGERLAGPVLVNSERRGLQSPTAIVAKEGTIAVSWFTACCDLDDSPFDIDLSVRTFRDDLTPRTPPIGIVDGDHPERFQVGMVVTLRPGDRFTVAWTDWRDRPGMAEPEVVHLQRTFRFDGTPTGAATQIEGDWESRRLFGRVATPAATVWYFWLDNRVEGPIQAQPFSAEGVALAPPTETGLTWTRQSIAFEAASDPAGRILAAIYPFFFEGPVEIATIEGATPPASHVLTSPDLPGFRVWVLIGASSPAPRWGTEEPLCLAETLCASGAVPGRVEVLVRVVGPKPNGFLWPTLVKLSTSDVDVWIEQTGTGEVRHYFLPGGSPGMDVLPGLFDRFGFSPN